ncbi:MAG: hypothetical protein K0S61_126 [Anaerocolumna sp.]|jgi:predicted phage tail component-like protein|nr:hypothetical protein [Anaerocolumna sp.]
MLSINFNNSNSFEDLGLVMEHRPIIPIPKRNSNQLIIPGRNGSLTEDEETYGDIEIPIDFGVVDFNNMHDKARLIRKWIVSKIIDNRLIFSDDDNNYYKVKSVSCTNIERTLIVLGRFTATFTCDPFIYSNDELTLTSPSTVYNPGTYVSTPYIKIFGTGNIDLIINGTTINLTGVSSYIELDSEAEECYKSTTLLNNQMIGEFPKLQPNENSISWSGSVTKIEITPRWRWL